MNQRTLFASIATCLTLWAPCAAAQSDKLDAATRAQVIDALVREVNDHYVFPEVAAKVENVVREKQKRGEYDKLESPKDLASMLTADVQGISRDLHLNVRFSDTPPPQRAPGGPSETEQAAMRDRMKAMNYGISKLEKLPGNIGYLELRGFLPVQFAGQAITDAMVQLADSDALIIDLRNNGGGDPAGVAHLSSYLFDQRTHLNDLYWRQGNRTEEFWTNPDVAGKKYGQKKDVYVLTSGKTFSGAEEFSYNLQQLKRATLVGSTTRGGANPGWGRQLNPNFSVFVPNGRAINPITRTNWEGTGVTPDVKVVADDALLTAQKLALQKLAAGATDPQRVQILRARLAELDASGPAKP
jgi:hypothetical protein